MGCCFVLYLEFTQDRSVRVSIVNSICIYIMNIYIMGIKWLLLSNFFFLMYYNFLVRSAVTLSSNATLAIKWWICNNIVFSVTKKNAEVFIRIIFYWHSCRFWIQFVLRISLAYLLYIFYITRLYNIIVIKIKQNGCKKWFSRTHSTSEFRFLSIARKIIWFRPTGLFWLSCFDKHL